MTKMDRVFLSSLSFFLTLFVAGCGSDDPAGPTQPEPTMSALVDGARFEAVTVDIVDTGGGRLDFLGTTQTDGSPVRQIGIVVEGVIGVGTFALSAETLTNGATVTVTSGGVVSQWSTFSGGVGGTLTVTTFADDRIAGTFEFNAVADPGTEATGEVVVTEGTFDLRL